MKKIIITTLLISTIAVVGFAQTPDFQAMLETIDEQGTFEGSDFSGEFSMTALDPIDGESKQKMQMFRRDADDAFLILVLEPLVELGQGYLQVDDSLLFYDPESGQFSHTSLKESFEESDARNSDFDASSLADDYTVVEHSEGKLGNFDVWILDLEGKHDEVTYPTIKMWVSKDLTVALKVEEYSLSGRLLRTSYYPSYTNLDGKMVPTTMIYVDALVEGQRTTIHLSNLSTNDIPDDVFTREYIRRVNR